MSDPSTQEAAPAAAFELPEEVRRRFIDVVGPDAALVSDQERDQYRDPYWYQPDRSYDSSLVLFPSSTEPRTRGEGPP